jgi:hypothetical protein
VEEQGRGEVDLLFPGNGRHHRKEVLEERKLAFAMIRLRNRAITYLCRWWLGAEYSGSACRPIRRGRSALCVDCGISVWSYRLVLSFQIGKCRQSSFQRYEFTVAAPSLLRPVNDHLRKVESVELSSHYINKHPTQRSLCSM